MINHKYLELIEPENLIEHIDDFDAWLDLATCRKDLEDTLKRFEKSELYEYCALIRDKIDEKYNELNIQAENLL